MMDSSSLTTTKAPGVYSDQAWSTQSVQFNKQMVDDTDTRTALLPGTRVRIVGNPVALTLSNHYDHVVGPDDLDEDHYLVRLDSPATYHYADGRTEQLPEIVQAVFNLEAVPSIVTILEAGSPA